MMPTVAASSAGRTTTASSLTVSHTVPAGTDRYLVVLVDCSAAITLTATYGGVALTQISDIPGGFHLYAFGLANPTVGTANVVLTGTASGTITASVLTLTECVAVGLLTSVSGSSTAPSITVSSSVGELVLDLCATAVAGVTFTVGPGQTSILEQDGLSGAAGRIATSSEPGAASVTMSWTLSATGSWIIGALTAYGTMPVPPARVTQAVIEILGATTAVIPPAHVTQAVVEILSGTPPIPVRVTHQPVEVFFTPLLPARVTQVAVEAYFPIEVPVRSTQQVVELFDARTALTQVTQAIVEIWWVPICGEEYPKLPLCEANGWPLLPEPSVTSYPILPLEECMDASTFITNMALQEIGISKQIGSLLDDTSQEAYCARLIFTDVVDTVLRDHPWKFATEYAALVWLAGSLETPVNPDWTYTYHLPDDCVRVRRVCEPALQRRYTVTPIPFDQRATPDGVKDILLCNEPGGGQLELTDPPTITIEYTKRLLCPGQVNDAQFRECLVMKLAARMAKALARDSKDADRALRNYSLALPKAQTQHSNDSESQRPTSEPPDWITGR